MNSKKVALFIIDMQNNFVLKGSEFCIDDAVKEYYESVGLIYVSKKDYLFMRL